MLKRTIQIVALPALLVAIWAITSANAGSEQFYYSTPNEVWTAFRDTWFGSRLADDVLPSVLRLLSAHNIALCLSDHHDAPAPWKRTADFVYIRGHGPGGRYKGHYRQQTLSKWATRIRSWKRQGCDIFVYFDNDQKSAAPADALKLQLLLS